MYSNVTSNAWTRDKWQKLCARLVAGLETYTVKYSGVHFKIFSRYMRRIITFGYNTRNFVTVAVTCCLMRVKRFIKICYGSMCSVLYSLRRRASVLRDEGTRRRYFDIFWTSNVRWGSYCLNSEYPCGYWHNLGASHRKG